MVEFGFAVPASLHEIPVSVRVETAEQVEALGYESFWMPHSVARDVAAFDTLDTLCAARCQDQEDQAGDQCSSGSPLAARASGAVV